MIYNVRIDDIHAYGVIGTRFRVKFFFVSLDFSNGKVYNTGDACNQADFPNEGTMRFVNYSVFYRDLKIHGLEYAARHSRELGFEAVEFLDIVPFGELSPINRYSPDEVKRVLREYHLEVSCFSVAVNLDCEEHCEQLLRAVDYAASIASPRFHHTVMAEMRREDIQKPYEEVFETVYPYVARVAEHCRARGIECLYEPQGFYFNGVEGLGRLFDRLSARFSNVGICGDVANSLFVDVSAESIYNAFAKKIKHVHVKDYRMTDHPDPETEPYVSRGGTYLYDCPIGAGVTDFRYCFETLKAAGYRGDVAFEILGDDRTILQAMDYVKKLILSTMEKPI